MGLGGGRKKVHIKTELVCCVTKIACNDFRQSATASVGNQRFDQLGLHRQIRNGSLIASEVSVSVASESGVR